jgi:hypothetical protein
MKPERASSSKHSETWRLFFLHGPCLMAHVRTVFPCEVCQSITLNTNTCFLFGIIKIYYFDLFGCVSSDLKKLILQTWVSAGEGKRGHLPAPWNMDFFYSLQNFSLLIIGKSSVQWLSHARWQNFTWIFTYTDIHTATDTPVKWINQLYTLPNSHIPLRIQSCPPRINLCGRPWLQCWCF